MKLPAAQPLPGFPVLVDLGVSVADVSGRAVEAVKSYLAHPAGIYVGIKTPILAEVGKESELKVAAATAENEPVQSVEVSLSAFREIWETVRERGPGGFWRHVGQARRTLVWREKVMAGEKGAAARFTPPDTGTYVIVAEVRDSSGRINRSASYLYAVGPGLAGWQRFDDHRLELKAQPAELEPGQTARIMIQNPFPKATALITNRAGRSAQGNDTPGARPGPGGGNSSEPGGCAQCVRGGAFGAGPCGRPWSPGPGFGQAPGAYRLRVPTRARSPGRLEG